MPAPAPLFRPLLFSRLRRQARAPARPVAFCPSNRMRSCALRAAARQTPVPGCSRPILPAAMYARPRPAYVSARASPFVLARAPARPACFPLPADAADNRGPPLALHCPAPLFRLSTAALNAPAPRHTFNMRPRPFFCLPILSPARPAPPVSACPRRVLPGSPRPPRRNTSTISPFSLCKRTHLPRFFAPHSIKRDKIGNIENNHRHFTRFVLQWTQFKAVFP